MQIDEKVSAKVDAPLAAKLLVTRSTIQDLATKCKPGETSRRRPRRTLHARNSGPFSVLEPWESRFCERQELLSAGPLVEAGSLDAPAVSRGVAVVYAAIPEYEPSCVSNVNETEPFCQGMLPKRMYLAPGEKRNVARSVKGTAVKDGITLHACPNVTGLKVSLAVIESCEKPL